ncbi:hypothetical protein C2845_PM14G04250 [Panicum miliaceum]|uniref:hAT-like transposase RNase-H fold domain-containing protein n=1 Tax=Panicum miliaceum TaxID=4540 RepID=A0A3L6PMA4_PANMI|nr:hypothetical protein C2845_PM14G04250 [Panicum miliaceum]
MDHMDDQDSDDIQAGVASCGSFRFRKKESMAWEYDKCKPLFVDGVIQRPSTEVWKDFIPLYADGRTEIMAAECANCHVRLNANKNAKFLNRHIQTCPARGSRTSINQDELSLVLTNVEVQFSEYGSKFLKCSSGDRTPVDRCVSASPAQKRMGPKKDGNMSSAQTLHNWKLQRRIIKFGAFRTSTTNLDRMIHLKEAPVLDSESGPFNLIWEAIRDWNLDQAFELDICCIVSEEQPLLHVVGDILEKFIQAHMSSSLIQQQLIEVMTSMTLKCPHEDVKRWHKIYFGLEVIVHFKKAFPSEELLSAKDTKTVDSVCNILRAFCHAVEMQEAFDEYWQNSYVWLSAPAVLDPRFKIAFIEFCLKQAFGMMQQSMYLSYVIQSGSCFWNIALL